MLDPAILQKAKRLGERLGCSKDIVNFVGNELGWGPDPAVRRVNFYKTRASGLSWKDELLAAGVIHPRQPRGFIGYRSDIARFLGTREP